MRKTLLLTRLIVGCSRGESPPPPASSEAAASVPAGGFQQLSAGCSGGITGGGTGVTLFQSGALYRWNQPGPTSHPRDSVLVKVDSALAAKLHRQLVEARFEALSLTEPANMTCFLTLRGDTDAHEVAWPIGAEEKLPAAVKAVYEELIEAGKEDNN
jgi:hypothetical protein